MNPRPALHIVSRRFKMSHRVAVVPNKIRGPKDRAYIWKLLALDGTDTGRVVGIATQVALTGPVTCLPVSGIITGYLATEQVWLTNATHQADGVWSAGVVMDAAMLTSDGEVWTVHRSGRPKARVRFWDKDFQEVDAPARWKVISN